MKHFYLGLGILMIILALGIIALGLIDRDLGKTADALERAFEASCQGDYDAAQTWAKSARQDWERGYGLTASLVDHAPLDEVNRIFFQMEASCAFGKWDEFARACRELMSLIGGIADREKPLYYNIL